MTQLPDTTTEAGRVEASVMLAELCGWLTSDGSWHRYMPPSGAGASVNHAKGQEITTIFALCPTLYDPANMALAWRVLNWREWVKSEEGGGLSEKTFFVGFGDFEAWMKMPPVEAQRRWLDKILSLAIKEGMLP